MARLEKQGILPDVHEILRQKLGDFRVMTKQGVAKGERLEFSVGGRAKVCIIKTSTGGRISFGRTDSGGWSGLDDADYVVVVAPDSLGGERQFVSLFEKEDLLRVFEANQAAQVADGKGHLPNWIAPFHEPGRGVRGTGDGFGSKAKWIEPLNPGEPPALLAVPTPEATVPTPAPMLTIGEAKRQLSISLGVPPEAIEITVRA